MLAFHRLFGNPNDDGACGYQVRTTLCIQVEHVDFDQSACHIRLRGKNIKENKVLDDRHDLSGTLYWMTVMTCQLPCIRHNLSVTL